MHTLRIFLNLTLISHSHAIEVFEDLHLLAINIAAATSMLTTNSFPAHYRYPQNPLPASLLGTKVSLSSKPLVLSNKPVSKTLIFFHSATKCAYNLPYPLDAANTFHLTAERLFAIWQESGVIYTTFCNGFLE